RGPGAGAAVLEPGPVYWSRGRCPGAGAGVLEPGPVSWSRGRCPGAGVPSPWRAVRGHPGLTVRITALTLVDWPPGRRSADAAAWAVGREPSTASGARSEQAYISAEQSSPREDARIPPAH